MCVPYFLDQRQQLLTLSQLLEGGDNSSYAGGEAREVFINTSNDYSGASYHSWPILYKPFVKVHKSSKRRLFECDVCSRKYGIL